jgi:GDP-L-fucose synthase
MRILLTGARGMVGRNIVDHPGARAFHLMAPTSAELNLCDYRATRDFLVANRPDLVIHAAGKVGGIQANMREPVSFLVDNIDMGRNIVLAAREASVPRLLNLGSSCMYPRGCKGALKEDMVLTGALEPTNEGYALAKIATARLCGYVMRENPAAQYKTLIPCNLYGRHDKFEPARSHLIPAIIHKIHAAIQSGAGEVDIWGNGEARREFMYAGDLADAIVRAVTHFDTLPAVMNLGLGYDHSINEYYAAVAAVMGFDGRFTHDLSKPVGMARKLVDVRRQTDWGWAPAHTLQKGIASTYAFYLKEYCA